MPGSSSHRGRDGIFSAAPAAPHFIAPFPGLGPVAGSGSISFEPEAGAGAHIHGNTKWPRRSKTRIPLSTLKSAKIEGGRLCLQQMGRRRNTVCVSSGKIPNVLVFLEVLARGLLAS